LVFACGDNIKVEGTTTTRGCLDLSDEINLESCDLINQMSCFGAIQLVKGNTSQSNIPFCDANNLIWG
jgi:Asp-tRNA(Asn)/Glu-tRNA(Gln) amidotransferase A subunit family amidase